MSVRGIGSDIIEISRIKRSSERSNSFLVRIFTKNEIDYATSDGQTYEHLAGRFAAKEAVIKAFGEPFAWTDIETLNDKNGKPFLNLFGRAKQALGNGKIHITISHTHDYAVATALLEDD